MSERPDWRILGLDVGIASCGWGIISVGDSDGGVVAAGVRCFDAPLVEKTGEPKSASRRTARGQRRIVRRRRQRMDSVRRLLNEHHLLNDLSADALRTALQRLSEIGSSKPVTPWGLRAVAHDRLLTTDELAVVLGHIARHRGFRSNSKSDAGVNAADETSKNEEGDGGDRCDHRPRYRSFRELAKIPKFADRHLRHPRIIPTRPSAPISRTKSARSSAPKDASAVSSPPTSYYSHFWKRLSSSARSRTARPRWVGAHLNRGKCARRGARRPSNSSASCPVSPI